MSSQNYLLRGGNGYYYFRMRVPKRLRQLCGKKEIKKSLNTQDLTKANRLAMFHASTVHHLFAQLDSRNHMTDDIFRKYGLSNMKELIVETTRKPDGSVVERIEMDPDKIDAEKELLEAFREQYVGKHITELNNAVATSNGAVKLTETHTLSELIEKYLDWYPSNKTNVSASTIADYRAKLRLLIYVLGDISNTDFTTSETNKFEEIFAKLPQRIATRKEYRGKTCDQILAMKIPSEHIMTSTTRRGYVIQLRSFSQWAHKRKYFTDDFFGHFGLPAKNKQHAHNERDVFSRAELRSIFSHPVFTDHAFSKASQYWIPLIALFQGMRLEEICALRVADIILDDFLCAISINVATSDKQLKNKNASRVIPIHPSLIDFGFLKFVHQQKQRRATRLFTELKRYKCNDGTQLKYGHKFSQHFNETFLRKELGIDSPKKVFHSFRHNFSNELKQNDCIEPKANALTGHERSVSITYDRYGKPYQLFNLVSELVKIDYSTELAKVTPWDASGNTGETKNSSVI